ncbi:MAG TPA: NUDIX hydrolase [Clostridiaceae bacterium]|nr:NUDIX hydrolase [Clostridiaceae bacterium]
MQNSIYAESDNPPDMTETTLSSEIIFEGKIVTVERQMVRLMDGSESMREIVHHSGGAAVLPVDENGYVYLIRQYRKALESETLEIPAGKLEVDEDPYYCAVRELKEETGFEADRVESMGSAYPTPGYCDEKIYLYLATGLKSGRQDLDPGEFLRVVRMHLSEVIEAVMDGRIHDAKTVIALLKAKEMLQTEWTE